MTTPHQHTVICCRNIMQEHHAESSSRSGRTLEEALSIWRVCFFQNMATLSLLLHAHMLGILQFNRRKPRTGVCMHATAGLLRVRNHTAFPYRLHF